jgi:hypothetical protein
MRSRLDVVARHAGVGRGLRLGRCGVGGVLETVSEDLDEAVIETTRQHGERMARRLERFAALPQGTTAWTCEGPGAFHRGALDGPWFYDPGPGPGAIEVDLVHVRGCRWTTPREVPPDVVTAFARGSRNFQRIGTL